MSDFAEKLVILFLFFSFLAFFAMCVHMYRCVLGVVFLCALKEMSVCVWSCMLCRTDVIVGVYVFGGVFHWCG